MLAFAKRFGVITEPGDPSAPVVHNLRTAVIDSEGRLVKAYSGNTWSPAELVADLKAAPLDDLRIDDLFIGRFIDDRH